MNRRETAILRDVRAGRVVMTCSCEPDLYVGGVHVCDQFTAHRLASAGLIQPVAVVSLGQRVRAELTPAGLTALATGVAT